MSDIDSYVAVKDIKDFFPKPEEINTGTITNSNKTKGISFAVVPDYMLPATDNLIAKE